MRSSSGSGFVQVNTNGVLHSAAAATISPLNRGYLYGDSVYEVWRTYDGHLFAWEDHWARLERSAAAVYFKLPVSRGEILAEVGKTAAAFRHETGDAGDLYIRLQIYRGAGEIGLDTHLAVEPGYTILVKPVPTLSPAVRESGLRLEIARNIRRNPVQALNPAWKTGNYLNNIVGLREARDRGADDVLFLNIDGALTEASTSNVAFIAGDTWVTPPRAAGILAGITRERVLRGIAGEAGLRTVERDILPSELGSFTEAMLLSTTKDVQPVGRIGGQTFEVGPSARLWRLKEVFVAAACREVVGRKELRV